MRMPQAPEYDSTAADLAADFQARCERARALLEDLETVRRRAHERELARTIHTEPEQNDA